MNRKRLFVAFIVLVAIAVGVFFLLQTQEPEGDDMQVNEGEARKQEVLQRLGERADPLTQEAQQKRLQEVLPSLQERAQ
jgi:hypothetical protein